MTASSRAFCVRANSLAFSCDAKPEESERMRPVELNAWFDYGRGDSEVELWEESVCFPALETVMTLLCIV